MDLPKRIYANEEVRRLYRDLEALDVQSQVDVSGGAPAAHAASHLPGGSDALATGTPGAATPGDAAAEGTATSFARSDHKHSLPAFGSTAGTFCQGNDSRLSDARSPTGHHTSHESGGSDAIKLDDLAAPDDNTDLNASTSKHGLLPKLSGSSSDVLRGDGTFGAGGGGFSAAYYLGYSTTSATWSSTTWSDIHNILTITDTTTVNISRSGSTFTVTDAGVYVIDLNLGAYNSAGNDYMSVRILSGGSTVQTMQFYSESGSARTAAVSVHAVLSLAAGGTFSLQYAVSATWNAFGPVTIDSEAGRSANITVYRIS